MAKNKRTHVFYWNPMQFAMVLGALYAYDRKLRIEEAKVGIVRPTLTERAAYVAAKAKVKLVDVKNWLLDKTVYKQYTHN